MRTGSFRTGIGLAWRDRLLNGADRTDTKAIVFASARTIYFPVPKAANSSARVALAPTAGVDASWVRNQADIHAGLIPDMPGSAALRMAGPGWFVFTIVRDPFLRAYSAWYDKLESHETPFKPLRSIGLERGDSFERYLWVLNAHPMRLLNDHFMPQRLLLARALEHPGLHVYHMEDLPAAWAEISDRIEAQGGTRPDALPHMNRTRKPARPEFSRMERRLLNRLYRDDFAPLGYSLPG